MYKFFLFEFLNNGIHRVIYLHATLQLFSLFLLNYKEINKSSKHEKCGKLEMKLVHPHWRLNFIKINPQIFIN